MPEILGKLITPRLASAPASPTTGEVYFNTATNKLYWWSGTAWVAAEGGAAAGGVDYIGNWAAGTPYKKGDVVRYNNNDYLAVNDSTGSTPPAAAPSGGAPAWGTGDTKISAKAATHADPQGGTWYLADGSAIPGGETGLIALLGANFPDAPGRVAVIKGTNAAVNAIGKSDTVTTVANRRPQHRHTPHYHGAVNGQYSGPPGTDSAYNADYVREVIRQATTSVDGGSGVATDALDGPAFIVAGNLFYHS